MIIFRDGLTVDNQTGKIYAIGNKVAEINAQLGISNVPAPVVTTTSTPAPVVTTTSTPASTTNLTIANLLADTRVTQDKGVNGVTMAKWLQGNASLLPALAAKGYTLDDIVNEAYAQTRTNRSAFSGNMMTTPRDSNTATTATTTPTPNPVSPTPTPVSPTTDIPSADQKWINDLYQKYFDRAATSKEIENWAKENPQALEQYLGGQQKDSGYTSKAMGTENKARYDAAMKIIDDSTLPPEIKSLWKLTVGKYPNAKEFNTDEIITAFNAIKSSTVDPYYKELADIAISDTRTAYGVAKTDRDLELEAERAKAGEDIRQAKAGQEKAGMTFTGKAIENLGAESAYPQADVVPGTTPAQIPFAGLSGVFNEGKIQQASRLISTSSAARYGAAQQQLGSKLEGQIGTAGVAGANLGLNYIPSGVNLTASQTVDKEQKLASTLTGYINQWEAKQKSAQNI